jgi:hypothetical protein
MLHPPPVLVTRYYEDNRGSFALHHSARSAREQLKRFVVPFHLHKEHLQSTDIHEEKIGYM